jgi:hypothetical protein
MVSKLQALELCDLVGQLLDNRLVAVDLLAHGLDRLAHRLDLLVERLDTLYQLRRQRAQLFRIQVVGIRESHGADFARAGSSRRWIDRIMAAVKAV